MVVPKSMRVDVGFAPGEVEIVVDDDALRISPVATDDVEERDGILVVPDGDPLSIEDLQHLRLADQR